MIDYYIDFLTAHWIAVCVFVSQLAIRLVVRHFNLRPDEQDLKPWVQRYRNLPEFWWSVTDKILLTTTSLVTEWWILEVILPMYLPMVNGGVYAQMFTLAWMAMIIGIGLSIGKATFETDYQWYTR